MFRWGAEGICGVTTYITPGGVVDIVFFVKSVPGEVPHLPLQDPALPSQPAEVSRQHPQLITKCGEISGVALVPPSSGVLGKG